MLMPIKMCCPSCMSPKFERRSQRFHTMQRCICVSVTITWAAKLEDCFYWNGVIGLCPMPVDMWVVWICIGARNTPFTTTTKTNITIFNRPVTCSYTLSRMQQSIRIHPLFAIGVWCTYESRLRACISDNAWHAVSLQHSIHLDRVSLWLKARKINKAKLEYLSNTQLLGFSNLQYKPLLVDSYHYLKH